MTLQSLMKEYQQRVDKNLDLCLPFKKTNPHRLHEAMRYAIFNGGKRIRPSLVYLTGKALNVDDITLDAPACAVELIHAYSLVHDDLPAMDDDDLRRGKPSCHKAFDEATAILAGDALQSLAFYVVSNNSKMIQTLALASGSRGMVGGQAIDIAAIGKSLNIAELENMHIHKTGALIRASVKMGALACQTIDDSLLNKLDHYAKCIGLAFQIKDDILDIEANTETLGKTQGADLANDKVTYPSLLGLNGAKQMATELIEDAINSLNDLNHKADPLRWIASYILNRHY
jgi:geranylgeranyl pyrophosphate synthase